MGSEMCIRDRVLTNEQGETKGSGIKGPVSREAAERWPRIAAAATTIV